MKYLGFLLVVVVLMSAPAAWVGCSAEHHHDHDGHDHSHDGDGHSHDGDHDHSDHKHDDSDGKSKDGSK